MSRTTPEQLQAAKRRKAEQAAAEAEAREQKQEQMRQMRERHAQISSVVTGLYEEVDKLAKKWPTMEVSNLVMERTNRAIRVVKGLLSDEQDEFVGEVQEIISAGDPPQNRDVLLLLRELKDALERMRRKYAREWD